MIFKKYLPSSRLVASSVITTFIATLLPAQAASLDVRGFASVGASIANNDAGYAWATDELDFKRETILGLQLAMDLSPRFHFSTQLVANGVHEFKPDADTLFLQYTLPESNTLITAGRMRTPFFTYSDYLDIGYAYIMLRPDENIYHYIPIHTLTGISSRTTVALGEGMLEIQPFYGMGLIKSEESVFGDININNQIGLTLTYTWHHWTNRFTTATGETEPSSYGSISKKRANFYAIGTKYDDGLHFANAEAMLIEVDDIYADVGAVSITYAYRFDKLKPYLSSSYLTSFDDHLRDLLPIQIHQQRSLSYSLGLRYELDENLAVTTDVTYADFRGTSGALYSNMDETGILFPSTTVYSVNLDFIF